LTSGSDLSFCKHSANPSARCDVRSGPPRAGGGSAQCCSWNTASASGWYWIFSDASVSAAMVADFQFALSSISPASSSTASARFDAATSASVPRAQAIATAARPAAGPRSAASASPARAPSSGAIGARGASGRNTSTAA
jgi:hypothetical protein